MTAVFRRRGKATGGGRPTIKARKLVAAAMRAGGRHWRSILGAAVVVFGLSALAETAVETLASDHGTALTAVIGVMALGFDLVGEVFFTGLLDRLVGEAHGRPAQNVPTVLRTLPYRRLILADVLITILVVVGLAALILPGVILFTLLSLSGPIVNIEGRSAVSALRRSARLVRGQFKVTFLLVTVPFFLADWAGSSIEDTVHSLPFAAEFVIHLMLAIVIAVITSLIQVELAHRLIELDIERAGATKSA